MLWRKCGPRNQPSLALFCLRQEYRARKRHINFEHINLLKVGTTLGQPAGQPEGKVYISCVSRRTHNFLAQLTLGQPAVCPRAIWTLTRAKSLCLCAFVLPENREQNRHKCSLTTQPLGSKLRLMPILQPPVARAGSRFLSQAGSMTRSQWAWMRRLKWPVCAATTHHTGHCLRTSSSGG